MESIVRLTFLNKIFNVRGNEWSRISLAWLMRFFYRFAFVVGWTSLVALFVSRFGIKFLPYLFILTASFTFIGSLFYSVLLNRIRKRYVLIATILGTVICLFLSLKAFYSSEILFFSGLIVVFSVFLNQLKILLIDYIEEMFTALESERTFPLIEASETLAGIFAGLLIAFFASNIEVYQFFYFSVISISLILPFIFINNFVHRTEIYFEEKRDEDSNKSVIDKFMLGFKDKAQFSYIKGLILIVFFQWVLYNLIEFQYTAAIYHDVSSKVLNAGSGFEHALVHNLGTFFILFSVSSLFIQLFIGSRLLQHLGIVGTMLLHSVVTFFSVLGLAFSFTPLAAIMTKNNFTMTTILHTNAYHSSYYAIDENFRQEMRELLEGFIRPIGAILGTLMLILVQLLIPSEFLNFYLNVVILTILLLVFYITHILQKKYTNSALDELKNSHSLEARINAVDILMQRGHCQEYIIPHFRDVLNSKNGPIILKAKILKALGSYANMDALKLIVKFFKSEKIELREAALDALIYYKDLSLKHYDSFLIQYCISNELKEFYKKEKNPLILSKILHLMSSLSELLTTDFLFSILKSRSSVHKADAILALRDFTDEEVLYLLKPYLKSGRIKESIYASITLNKFEQVRKETEKIVSNALYSKNKNEVIYSLFAVGELTLKQYKNVLIKLMKVKDSSIRLHSIISLLKLGESRFIPELIDLLFTVKISELQKIYLRVKSFNFKFSVKTLELFKKNVDLKIKIHTELHKHHGAGHLDKEFLERLKFYYSLIGEYHEVYLIDDIIHAH